MSKKKYEMSLEEGLALLARAGYTKVEVAAEVNTGADIWLWRRGSEKLFVMQDTVAVIVLRRITPEELLAQPEEGHDKAQTQE